MERYLEGEEISHDEDRERACKKGVEGHLFLVTWITATKNLGSDHCWRRCSRTCPRRRSGARFTRSEPTTPMPTSRRTSPPDVGLRLQDHGRPLHGADRTCCVWSLGVLRSDCTC